MTFAQRDIDVTITLAEGPGYEPTLGATTTLSGLRVHAEILHANGWSQGELHLKVFGLKQDMISRLTSIGIFSTDQKRNNTIRIDAGNRGELMTDIYEGTILTAYGDYQGMPDTSLDIVANAHTAAGLRPIPASSWRKSVSVNTIMASLAKLAGYTFVENNDVSESLYNPYFPGSAWDQIQACAQHANINAHVENGALIIYPKGGYRKGVPTITVSSTVNMIGYPILSSGGITVNSEFIPDIYLGGLCTIDSSLLQAVGTWHIYSINHKLQSETPGGQWFTQLGVNHIEL